MKRVTILGATGSIGQSAADVIASQPDLFAVETVTANRNADLLAARAKMLKARRAVVADPAAYAALKAELSGSGIETACGPAEVAAAAAQPADIVLAGIVGMAGLEPVLKALEQGTAVALANKEPLVAAGGLVMKTAARRGAALLPVDSEHNAIFQVFDRDNAAAVERLVLTASGGPFRTWTAERMAAATPEQAVAHPNWSMGAKISVDSATMMNKALEVIEAHHLFSMSADRIEVVVHPQSVVHSMVEYADGSVLAQLGAPDMRTPIAHALAWPRRISTPGLRLDWRALKRLDFEPVDHARFPAVRLAYRCLEAGPWACAAFNAANETAVEAFLAGKAGFADIHKTVDRVLESIQPLPLDDLADIMAFDRDVRRLASAYIYGTLRDAEAAGSGKIN